MMEDVADLPRAPDDPPAAEATEPSGSGPGASDHELIRGAQAGRERAFEELVRRYEQRAFRVARNLVPSADDARDLVQEAFLRVFRSLDRFDFEHEFSTWLHRIVTNLAIDHLRRRRPTFSTAPEADDDGELDLPDEEGDRPDDALARQETAARVRACIDRLAPHFRTVMVLRELEGLPCTRIAEIVGATHVTVRWRLHRGRKLFQDEWERMEAAATRRALERSLERAGARTEDPGPGRSDAKRDDANTGEPPT